MIRRPTNPVIYLCTLIVIVHAVILFVVIPGINRSVTDFYNQNVYADGYDQLAASLVAGNGYRFYPDTAKTLMREPGYPMVLAGIFLAFGNGITAVKLTNMFLALGAAWLMTRIARRLSEGRVLTFVSPLLFLFHPGTLIAESRGGVEILFVLCLTLFILTVYRAIESNRCRDYVVSGAVLGLTVLVKSTLMLFPLFLLGYLVVFNRQRHPKLVICRNILVMIMTMFGVLSPWIIRNYILTEKFVPTASVLGVSAHAGQYICTHLSSENNWVDLDREAAGERTRLADELGYASKHVTDGYYQYFYSSDDELRFSTYLLKRVVAGYEDSPSLFIRCASSNLFNIWFAGKTWKSTGMNLIVQIPYLVLAIIGAVLALRNGEVKIVGPLVLLITYYVAVYVPILAQARYSVPLIPFLSLLACMTLVAAQRWLAGGAWTSQRITEPADRVLVRL